MAKTPAKRWLIVTQYYPPEIGAPQIRLRCLTRELREHGVEVQILTAMPNYPKGEIFPGYPTRKFSMREEIDGVSILRVWIYPGTGKSVTIRLLNYLSFTCTALIAALFGSRPDLIILESQPLSLGIVGLVMKWVRRVPYVYHVPDLQIDVAKQVGFIQNEAFLGLALRLENLFLKQSWKVSTVTRRFMTHFQERGLPKDQITFLPNGADSRFLHPQPACPELLERWNLHGKQVFLYVGTHAFYHGLDTLIHAAKLLQDQKHIVILMVGNGPERTRIIALAKKLKLTNVVFGQSPYEEMDKLYSVSYASIAVLRDLEVAKSMRLSKIFPSLSCGVPVIYSGNGEAADVIRDNQCGVTVPPENSQALADAIQQLAADGERRADLGRAARKFVESDYSWKIIVSRWIQELGVTF